MGNLAGSNAQLAFGDYSTSAAFANLVGQQSFFDDVDVATNGTVATTQYQRECYLVKNGSGSAIAAGAALNFVSGYWGTQVQACPAGSPIRLFAPSYVRGSTSNTIPVGGYFFAVKKGPISPLSDGTAIAIDDSLIVGAASGQVRTDYGLGGGLVYAATAASAAVTTTAVATKFDKSYTFPVNSLYAGDVIRVVAEAIATATNSTDTLTLELMIGSTVIASTGAIDVANNDSFLFQSDITIRTSGASGTLVATTNVNTATGNATFKSIILGSTAIDTTATQQVAVRATWSSNNAGNSCRLDVFNISRLNTAGVGLKAGTAMAVAAGGSSVQFRAMANCMW